MFYVDLVILRKIFIVTTTNHLPFRHYEPTSFNTCEDIFRRGEMNSNGNNFFLIKYLNVHNLYSTRRQLGLPSDYNSVGRALVRNREVHPDLGQGFP